MHKVLRRPIPLALALALSASPLGAQSLPPHRPLNPMAASRSSLALQPYQAYSPYRRSLAISVEYGNAIEYERPADSAAAYLLDAELMRTTVAYTRDLSPRLFVTLQGEVLGSYAGFADGFFRWYHDLIGYYQPEREIRPRNTYGNELDLPDGTTIVPEPTPLALGDMRATFGVRHTLAQQTAFTVTLPTATGSGRFGRGTAGLAAVHTLRLQPLRRMIFEGTIGAGFTPRHGPTSDYQRTAFASGSTGIRIRLWGGQSVYGYFFYHSPYYRGTGLPSLDGSEATGDFGWIMRDRRGREWRIGMSEDLGPGDPGIDLILKVSHTM